MGSKWRAFIHVPHVQDMDALRRAANTLGLDVGHSDQRGDHLVAPPACTSPSEVHVWAQETLPSVNGLARVLDPSFRNAEYEHRVQGPGDEHTSVFVSSTIEIGSGGRLSLSGSGVSPPPPVSTVAWDKHYERALKMLGAHANLDWMILYKMFELLRASAGGPKAFLQKTGLTKSQLSRFTESANRPDVSGDQARHAVVQGNSSGNGMTLEEGISFILKAMRSWTI